MAAAGPRATVSVVIPTFGRPAMLRAAVTSVLAQEVPAGHALEVVIGVSDPGREEDLEAARSIASGDPRVRVAPGPGRGPAGARNAAVAVASGSLLGFIDDDCEAQAGWLERGVAALDQADLAQGRTTPAADVPRFHHSISVTPLSGLWEASNLWVRREWLLRAGGFDERWNRAGRGGQQFGEDAEAGWRMVRAGARTAAAPDAVVHHAVVPRSRAGYLAYKSGVRRFPELFRTTPEARRVFYHGYFVSRRHVELTGALALLAGAVAANRTGRPRLSLAAFAGAASVVLGPGLRRLMAGDLGGAAHFLAEDLPEDALELVSALYGSARWRRLLL